MLSCGLFGRGPDGKCNKKPMKKGPPTSPLTVMPEKKKKDKEKGVRVSPVSFEKQGGRRKTRKKTRKKRKKKKRKTKKRRKRKKRKTKKRYRNQRGCKR